MGADRWVNALDDWLGTSKVEGGQGKVPVFLTGRNEVGAGWKRMRLSNSWWKSISFLRLELLSEDKQSYFSCNVCSAAREASSWPCSGFLVQQHWFQCSRPTISKVVFSWWVVFPRGSLLSLCRRSGYYLSRAGDKLWWHEYAVPPLGLSSLLSVISYHGVSLDKQTESPCRCLISKIMMFAGGVGRTEKLFVEVVFRVPLFFGRYSIDTRERESAWEILWILFLSVGNINRYLLQFDKYTQECISIFFPSQHVLESAAAPQSRHRHLMSWINKMIKDQKLMVKGSGVKIIQCCGLQPLPKVWTQVHM